MSCKCPFCKKPKFDIKDYLGNYVMHVTTKEQDEIFRKYLHSLGRTWSTGEKYTNRTYFGKDKNDICYIFNQDKYFNTIYYLCGGYRILEFEDFDWSDFNMKKNFTKKDLKNGDVVKISDGTIGIICLDTNTVILEDGYDIISELTEDLKFEYSLKNAQIVAVRRPLSPHDCQFTAFKHEFGTLVYERKEIEEMTLDEICKALGKEIKIVKEK